MKKFPHFLVIGTLLFSAMACGSDDPEPEPPTPPEEEKPIDPTPGGDDETGDIEKPEIPIKDLSKEFATFEVRDMALIYQGGAHRIDWTEEQIRPYVIHEFDDGTEEWLYDGYLFLDFKDGKGYGYAPGYASYNARKTEWEWYLGRLFERGKSLDALDKVITKGKADLGDPGFRHKIVLTILVPIDGQKDWGELDGKALDFDKFRDRKKAAMWFINELITQFKAQNYQNLDLIGFYWVAEAANESALPPYIANDIHELGYKFVWIPYWNAKGAADWQSCGFDIAYQQPNYFFDREVPLTRFNEMLPFAKDNHMGVEYECDERALTDFNYTLRMRSYTEAFETNDVFETAAVAHYTGSHLLLDVYNDPQPNPKAEVDKYASIIIKRRDNQKLLPK